MMLENVWERELIGMNALESMENEKLIGCLKIRTYLQLYMCDFYFLKS